MISAPPVLTGSLQMRNSSLVTSGGYRTIHMPFGQVVTLDCPFKGHPNNTQYLWYKNNLRLMGKVRPNGEKVSSNIRKIVYGFVTRNSHNLL